MQPTGGKTGPKVYATGSYGNDQCVSLTSPVVTLQTGSTLSFASKYDIEADYDAGIVEVADVGIENILVHDQHHEFPSLAFALGRLNTDDHSPTPFGIFRSVDRHEYASAVSNQHQRSALCHEQWSQIMNDPKLTADR